MARSIAAATTSIPTPESSDDAYVTDVRDILAAIIFFNL